MFKFLIFKLNLGNKKIFRDTSFLEIFKVTGGMPSSHSSGIIFLFCVIGFLTGAFSSQVPELEPAFLVMFMASSITIFDAMGPRLLIGTIVNFLNLKYNAGIKNSHGHKVQEVFGGIFWGLISAFIYLKILNLG